MQDTYGATLDEVDLGSQAAADVIDDWVEERTEGLIDEIAADLGLPSSQAVLVLLNAVYFLGTWSTTFDEDDTREAPFTLTVAPFTLAVGGEPHRGAGVAGDGVGVRWR